MVPRYTKNQQHSPITGTTILAIITVVLAAAWIAFAYYKGSGPILLLHPIVAIFLIVLLIRVYRWIEIKIIVGLELLMISLWLFVTLLDVLMPFLLGFGFAYLFRFLFRAIPFSKSYQRWIATVLIVFTCGLLLFWTGRQIGRQARQMSNGLQRFYYESVLPIVVGETLETMAVDRIDATSPDAAPPDVYLGTNHGIYRLNPNRSGITNGDIVGKRIQTIALTDKFIYAGTPDGLYRRAKTDEKAVWKKIGFADTSVQTLCTIERASTPEIYVGTSKGLYKGDGETWLPVAPETFGDISIVSVVKSRHSLYVAARPPKSASAAAGPPTRNRAGGPAALDGTRLWVLEFSSMMWSDFPSNGLPTVNILASDADAMSPLLSAGTPTGIYQFNAEQNLWEARAGAEHLPASISLLGYLGVGHPPKSTTEPAPQVDRRQFLYAGDKTVIRSNVTEQWPLLVEQHVGLLNTYKDLDLGGGELGLQVKSYLTQKIPSLAESTGDIFKWSSEFAGSLAFKFGGFLATVTFSFIVFVYAIQSFETYFRNLTQLIPHPHRDDVRTYLREVDENMQQFLKGQFTVIAIVSVVSCTAYWLIGVPFALLIGLLAGLCNAIPTFGPFIGGAFAFTAMLMGLAAGDFSIIGFLIRSGFVLVAILGIQMLDNSLISPKVMSRAVDVDPLLIMFGVIVGGAFLGFWGVLLAIPILVVIKSVIHVWHTHGVAG